MLNKDIIKKLSAILAATMIASCGTVSFADNTPVQQTEQGENNGTDTENGGSETTPGEGTETTPGEDTEPEVITQDISISANYTHDEKAGTYTVIFTTLTELEDVKNFDFTIATSAEGASIKSADFSEALDGGNAAVTKKSTSAVFADGAETTAVSGKVVLCTLVIESTVAPASENIAITDFTILDKDGKAVTVNPQLTVSDEPIVPELSEEEQEVYDMIIALPSADTLSFYTDGENKTLADIEELSETISATIDAYKALDKDEKANVDETLTFYNKTAEGIDELNGLVSDMAVVYDVLVLALDLNELKEEDLLSYKFMPTIYDDVIAKEIDESKLTFTDGSALKTQYEQAKTDISTKKSAIDEAYNALGTTDVGYEKKVKLIDSQFEVIQTLTTDKYYHEYLNNLVVQADTLKEDLEDYPVETTKKAFIQSIDDCIDKIEIIKEGVSSLPEVEFPSRINRRYNYTITLTREKKKAIEADVKVLVYKEGEKEKEIDSKKVAFEEGETKLDIKISALMSKYPGDENVDIYVYYTVAGAEFLVDSDTVFCKTMPSSASGIPSGGSSGSSLSGNKVSGGTKFPTASDKDDDDNDRNNRDDEEEEVLFEDIDSDHWAYEAIEGLYYAGIINGMEEGIFDPSGRVTREQFCKMVVQLFEVYENETESNFVDVNPDAWYAPYICSAISAGYVQGQSDEYFGIGEHIMRQDMATILYRAIGEQNSRAVLDFSDVDDIASYAEDAVSELVGLEVINGYEDGTFKPRGTATRAEAAKMIWGIYNIINE